MLAPQSRRNVGAAALVALLAVGPSDYSTPGSGLASAGARSVVGASRAYGSWSPSRLGECEKTIHDRYSVLGPDGRLYPTWHPGVDPSGCHFGHEHGRDPRGSALAASVGGIPFGYASELLAGTNAGYPREEHHSGHRIEWENGVLVRARGTLPQAGRTVRCDFLLKIHQGDGSATASRNSLHELAYHVRCDDRTELHVTLMSAIGQQASSDSRFAVFSASRYYDALLASLDPRPLRAWENPTARFRVGE